MKYIIDIPDDTTCINALKYEDSKCVAARSYIIPDLTPYTEPDLNITKDNSVHLCNSCNRMDSLVPCPTTDGDVLFGEDGKSVCCCKLYKPYTIDRKAIEDEVWDLAKACCDIMDYEWQLDTYRQAKGKIEAWKKQKDEIRVGDEVLNHLGKPYIIYKIQPLTNSFYNFKNKNFFIRKNHFFENIFNEFFIPEFFIDFSHFNFLC